MATISITLSESAYKRLKKLKLPGDSFSDVVMRELPEPMDTCGEILGALKESRPSKANPELRKAMLEGRGRRSTRR